VVGAGESLVARPRRPDVRLIRFTPQEAEYWDAPSNVVSNVKMVFALATGGPPDAGDHHKVAL